MEVSQLNSFGLLLPAFPPLLTDTFLCRGCAEDEEAGGSRRKKKKARVDGGMRRTRNMLADRSRGPKGFRDYLEEAELDRLPQGVPSYLLAAVGPPQTRSARKFCSVCGDMSNYTCTRCGARYCCIRCYGVHTDTRCLKFIA